MFESKRKIVLTAACLPVFVAGGLAVSVEPASAATTLHCGQTISVSTTMANNLTCSGALGLTVLGGVILDLGRHTLTGPGSGVGVRTDLTAGKAKVQNGTVTKWAAGIQGAGDSGSPTSISNVTVARNTVGVDIGPGDGALLVAGSRFKNNHTAGISIFRSGLGTIQTSTFDGNGIGINAISIGVTVTNSEFIRNTVAGDSEDGSLTVNNSTVERNHIGLQAGSQGFVGGTGLTVFHNGVGVVESDGSSFSLTSATVSANTVALRGTGIFGPGNVLVNSVLTGNGVGYEGYEAMRATGNTFTANGTAYRTFGSPDLDPAPTADGFDVFPQDVRNNTFATNTNGLVLDGVFPSPSRLGGNRAINNVAIGIRAPGAIDLGGNVAFGNGTLPQCVGIVCAVA